VIVRPARVVPEITDTRSGGVIDAEHFLATRIRATDPDDGAALVAGVPGRSNR
jgi:hypothetical protein